MFNASAFSPSVLAPTQTMAKRRDALREQLAARGDSVGEDVSFLFASAGLAALTLGAVYYFTVLAR
jgi:hypothetical protein